MRRTLAAAALLGLFGTAGLDGQLISPGALTAAHADLEGMRNCTNCHELRKRGIQESQCLSCHEPLARRIAAGTGLHARNEGGCADCHKEHAGRGFDIVRFDSLTFDHGPSTGFDLEGAHAEAACRDCHTPELIVAPEVRLFKRAHRALGRTWLGLATECARCHFTTDPHAGQFQGRECSTCHDQGRWDPASGFDHTTARFTLTGLHRDVACADCHPSTGSEPGAARYRPIAFGACQTCHADPHAGVMGSQCTDCHSTEGWGRISRNDFEGRFDHDGTGFPLVGAHADLACEGCHDAGAERPAGLTMTYLADTRNRSYPRPVSETCRSCHVDEHDGAFVEDEGGSLCTRCHTETAWLPSSFDLFRHDDETSFPLAGAHLAAPCASCHGAAGVLAGLAGGTAAAPVWHVEAEAFACADCHMADDPHGTQFAGRACSDCHGDTSFRIDAFDHDGTGYALDGAHADVACAGCHTGASDPQGREIVRYRPIDTACEACHGGAR